MIDGATVRRIAIRPDRSSRAIRLINVAYFPLRVALQVLLGPRYDVVMCSTAPPVGLAYLTSWAARRRGARFIYHCMDIHPEIGAISGEFRSKPVFRVLQRLDTTSCRRASRIIVLSSDMRDALVERDPELWARITVLNNFDLPTHEAPARAAGHVLPRRPGRTRLVFTGNLGRFQGLETLVQAVLDDDAGADPLELVFMGEGAVKHDLMRKVQDAPAGVRERVSFVPHGTPAEARLLIRDADYGVVSLTPGVIKFAYPSKCATYLSEGTPVLALVESDSELAVDVQDRGFGVAVDPQVPGALQTALFGMRHDPSARKQRARRAREVWATDFSQSVLLDRWEALLDAEQREELVP